uniref:Uncharacterized protein n=1 Tax=Nicotiana tabacum TaxID=4097 RepID=A0A1S3YWY9_TOBAC|nr:PREDICTED: uncharacterized protein LOC107780346 [Nicotiana tabacum]
MGNLSHLEAYQRPLARDVHRVASLGVRLADSSKVGVIMQNRAESSLFVEVKEKQYNDPLLKVVGDPSLIVPVGTIEFNEELTFEEIPFAILARQVRKMRNKKLACVKVLWRSQQVDEAPGKPRKR